MRCEGDNKTSNVWALTFLMNSCTSELKELVGFNYDLLLKHFKGALEAGATVKELAYILALVMREAAGADDCWTHDVLGDWKEILAGNVSCECEK